METIAPAAQADKEGGWIPPSAWLLLVAVLVLAGAVRFTGIRFGLPHRLARPDEQRIAAVATPVLEGNPNPRSFQYPSLLPYMNAMVRWAAMHTTHTSEEAKQRLMAFPAAYMTSRILSALLGTLTVVLVFFLGYRVLSVRAGLIAAALLALTHLHVRDSHFGVTDIPLTFFSTLAFLPALAVAKNGRWWATVLSAFFAGLAFSTKYPGGIVLVPVVVAHGIYFWPRRDFKELALRLAMIGFFFVLAFALTNPFAFLDPLRFLTHLKFELFDKGTPHTPAFMDRAWIQHPLLSIRYGLGIPFCLAAVAGIVLAFIRRRKGEVLFALFIVAYYIFMGTGTKIFVRYTMPIIPLLALTAAAAIDWGASRFRPSRQKWVASLLFLVAVSVSAGRVYHTCRLLAAEDTRLTAARVLNGLVGEKDRVFFAGRFTVPPDILFEDPRFRFEKGEVLDQLVNKDSDPLSALAGEYEYVVWGTYFFDSRFAPKPVTRRRLGEVLEPVETISPLEPGVEMHDLSPVFNRLDMLYLPYAGFRGFAHLGPFIHIFRVPSRSTEEKDGT